MPKSTPSSYARTKGEALLDLDFAIEISVLNQRFFERAHKAIALASLFAGSAAFVTIFHPNSVVVTIAGMVVGTLALVEQVYDFRGRATSHAALFKRYCRLRAKSEGMTLERLEAALSRLAVDTVPVIQGLRRPAYNNNVVSHGFPDYAKPLTRWERLLCTFTG